MRGLGVDPSKNLKMLLRRSSALASDWGPPQDCSTAVLRADQERRAAVTPAWNSRYGLLLAVVVAGGGALMMILFYFNLILFLLRLLTGSFPSGG